MRLEPGAEFAGFTIERVLGTGGMGVVYLARHPRLNRLVALKVLSDVIATDARGRARFEREAALAARLEHPNIVAIYDRAGADAETPWLCMKFIGGGDVSQLLAARHGPLTTDESLRILTDAAHALDHAHRHGILHRDVKPANILLDPSDHAPDRAVLTDFGIARALDDTLTATGMAATFAYAAPERFHGAPADHRADVYSLGCTFYELLTGTEPFPRPDQAAVIAAHLNTPPPRPLDTRPDLPPGFDDIIATALAKNPTDRYPTCGALADAATDILARARAARGNPRTAPTLEAPPRPEFIETLPPAPPAPATHAIPFTESNQAVPPGPESTEISQGTPSADLRPSSTPDTESAGAPSAIDARPESTGDPRPPDSTRTPPGDPDRPATGPRADAAVSRPEGGPRVDSAPGYPLDPLPESIRVGLDSPHPEIRRGAVQALGTQLPSGDERRADAARKALRHIATHDNPVVAPAAREVLGGAATLDSPRLPRARSEPGARSAARAEPTLKALRHSEAHESPGGGEPPVAVGSRGGRWSAVASWMSGVFAIIGAVLLLVARFTPGAVDHYDESRIDPLGYHGDYYLVGLAIAAAIAGASVLIPRWRRGIGQGLLVGLAVVGVWATIVVEVLGNRLNHGEAHSSGDSISTAIGFTFATYGHICLVLAGISALLALWLARSFDIGPRLPRDPLSIVMLVLALLGATAIGFTHSQFGGWDFLSGDYTWITVSAAATAAVPIAMLFMGSRTLAAAIAIGWALGGLFMCFFFYSLGRHLDTWLPQAPDGDGNPSATPVRLLALTLLALIATAALSLRRARR
ncbi:serine/threonine-protein kinase [Nocardia seriolae]|uniref:serine/threonine-protein kinase n=1 Tax=Nocardia seriolae TaxID=37332 RepID=UPI00068F5876|nr:serine/threonine-protein kinase [Nocardia seriolae]MTJ65147.1 protein kinase [Nocardia seriolae]MTJ71245.1 protein kinase [Nocardia seriolae]MTJ86929.1 protein kinase [Nocardia seriolae]MTK43101.1 protein kinase [Nocardia seriolae]MTK47497.1 protein kinase [Nocardia seriolae]